MYCGQCGKKVMENMLFCPFCGSPIVIPDQDEMPVQPVPEPAQQPAESVQSAPAPEEAAAEGPRSLFDEPVSSLPEEIEAEEAFEPERIFVPLSFDIEDQLAENREEPPKAEAEPEPKPDLEPLPDSLFELREEISRPQREEKRQPSRPVREENSRRRPPNTYIPVRELNLEDIFMDDVGMDDEEDDYDLAEPAPRRGRYRDEFEFEEPEHGGFLQRHIRGVVGLALLLVLALICLAWACSPKGQLALAKVNLAWTAEAYADLGYDAYRMDSDLLAARYYEKAYSRENDNYEYAHSAMVAYYEAGKIESAATMLKKCVEMAPDNPEPYQEMLILYPDAQSRPWEITELIRLGYQRTGHEALKPN